jgi:hypothetical protein
MENNMSSENNIPLEVSLAEGALEESKSSLGLFTLPGGYLAPDGKLYTEIELRELSGAEEDLLASKNIPSALKMQKLMAACTMRLGPLVSPEQVDEAVRSLIIGDRVFLLFALRRVSLTDSYPFKAECPHCKQTRTYHGDLSQLEAQAPEDPYKRVYDTELPSTHTVRWHPMTGHDEIKAGSRPDTGKDAATLAMLARIDLLDGAPPSLEAVKALSMRDRNFLRKRFDKAEGGIDTTMKVTCAVCEREFDREVDPADPGFFFPEE